MADERHYQAYMVRLWAVRHDGDLIWRASVENAHTGERRAFADVASLFDFLQKAVERLPPGEGSEGRQVRK